MSVPDYIPLDQFRALDWMSSRFPRPERDSYIKDLEQKISDIQALLGTPEGDRNMGVFGGTIIPDNTTLKVILQSLEDTMASLYSEAPVIASEAEAIDGTDNRKIMTPLRVNQTVSHLLGRDYLSDSLMGLYDSPNVPDNESVKDNLVAISNYLDLSVGSSKSDRASKIGAFNSSGVFQSVKGFAVSDAGLLTGMFISRNAIGVYDNAHVLNVQHQQSTANDDATVNFNRVSGLSGGTSRYLNQSLRVINSVYNSDAYDAVTNPYGKGVAGWDGESYENGLFILLNNGRTHVDSEGYAGQNCALVAFGVKQHANAGSTWGANIGVKEFAGSAKTSLTCALETDVHADGYDTNNVRLGITTIMKSLGTSDGNPSGFGEGYTGMWVSADGVGEAHDYYTGNWFSRWKRGFVASGPMDVAFDASGTTNDSATIPFGVNGIAFRMSRSSYLAFDRDSYYKLGLDSSNNLRYITPELTAIIIDPYGNMGIGNTGSGGSADNRIMKLNHATKDASYIASGNGIDVRISATGTIGVGFIGSFSDHDLLIVRNNTVHMRLGSDGATSIRTQTSANPIENGDITFQRASNTSLTLRMRGTDGVVRSGSVTLA